MTKQSASEKHKIDRTAVSNLSLMISTGISNMQRRFDVGYKEMIASVAMTAEMYAKATLSAADDDDLMETVGMSPEEARTVAIDLLLDAIDEIKQYDITEMRDEVRTMKRARSLMNAIQGDIDGTIAEMERDAQAHTEDTADDAEHRRGHKFDRDMYA